MEDIIIATSDGIHVQVVEAEYAHVPENFDASTVLCCDRKWADAANWLIGRIYLYSHFGMRQDDYGFAPLKVEYLRRVIPQTFERQLRDRLIERGVLQCDGHYIKGLKSMGYRLTERYCVRHRRVRITHPHICENIRRLRSGELSKLSDVHRHLHRQFDRLTLDGSRVEVNDPERLKWIDSSYLAAEQLRNHEWTPTVCEYGRFHTPLTRIMKEFRRGICLDGKHVVNVDIANSQPLVLGLLFLKVLSKNKSSAQVEQEDVDLYRIISEQAGDVQPSVATPYTMGKVNNNQLLKEDVHRYMELTQRGELYEFLGANSMLSRDRFKQKLFQDVFFGQNYIRSELAQEFERLFPSVMLFIRTIKRGNHARLAWLMQREESRLVIDTVCRRLMQEEPLIPLLTIHDSVMTSVEREGVVVRTIQEEFNKLGVSPTLRLERF